MDRKKNTEKINLQRFGPGIEAQGAQYDALFVIGGSPVYVFGPKITQEENARRVVELGKVIGNIYGCNVSIKYKKIRRGTKVAQISLK